MPTAPRRGSRVPLLGIAIATAMFLLGSMHPLLTSAAPIGAHAAYDRTADGQWTVAGTSDLDGFRGTAQIYRRVGTGWSLEATLAPSERGAFARFGSAVALSGNTLVIGAPWDDAWHGAAYVYERSGSAWRMTGRLAPVGSVGDRFGTHVESADGVVSLSAEDGSIVRFRRTGSGWTESERVVGGSTRLALNRPIDAGLIELTTKLNAAVASPELSTAAMLAPPTRVRASDGTYEDRTEIRWTQVPQTPILYKIYRRLASASASANTLIRVASQDDSLFADVSGIRGVEYTYCVSVVDMSNAEGPTECDNGRRIIFAPTALTASDGTYENFVRLRWSDHSSVEVGTGSIAMAPCCVN